VSNKGNKAKNQRRVSTVVQTRARSKSVFQQTDLFLAIGLALVTYAIYWQVISHQFISLDDDLYIEKNNMVTSGLTLSGLAWAFTTFHAANWHPVTWLSHMLDSQLFGLNAGYHLLVNASIHVANTLLLFVFLRRTTGTRWPSVIVAALFALHPLHVESVAWAAERKDTLSTFFGLLTILAYARYTEAPSSKRYALVMIWLGLGLMAKPMLVTWPFVLLLLDYWPLRRVAWKPENGLSGFFKAWWPLVREKSLLFALVIGSMIVTFIAQSQGGAVRGFADAPLSLRVSNAIASYGKYVLMTFWPANLAIYYPFPPDGIPVWQVALGLLAVTAITVFVFFQGSKRGYLLTGWIWFLGTLIPVIGLVQVGGQALADRYHYIPSIGLFVCLVFGLADLAASWKLERIGLAVSVVVVLIFGYLSALQISRWRDSTRLFQWTLSVTPDNLAIQYNLGHVLGQKRDYDEAIPHFLEALRIKPDFFDALLNMGVTLLEQGKPAEAISYYQRALSVEPNSSKAHMQLALALVAEKKTEEALGEFYRAKQLAPNDADVRTNLGLMLFRSGKLTEASEQLTEAVRLNPKSAEAHNNLGLVYLSTNQPDKAAENFAVALELNPNLAVARDNLKRAQGKLNTHGN
jgi:tetratricopeptide (TPR) repeat protein